MSTVANPGSVRLKPDLWRCALTIAILLVVVCGVATAADTTLIDAVKRGDTAAVRTALARPRPAALVNTAEPDGTTALHYAVQRNDLTTANLLIRAGADAKAANRYGVTPLVVACTNGNASIVQALLDAGADANGATPDGETALMTASRTGTAAAVKMLLARGANVNAKEQTRGQTALMWAASEDHPAASTALIEGGADVNARSNGGFTPLLFAVRGGSLETVKVLLAAGASVNDVIQAVPAAGRGAAAMPGGAAPAGRGATPAAAGTTAPATGRGAPPAANTTPAAGGAQATAARPAAQPRTEAENIRALVSVFNTGIRGRGGAAGTNALVLAITNAHFELAALLLDKGADPNADSTGWTPLHQLAWTRRPPIQHGLPPPVPSGNLDSLDLAKKLLDKGANPNARLTREPNDGARNILNRLGSTPFLQAAKLGDIAYMRLLLERGADASIATEEGVNPLMAAAGVGVWQVGESAGSNEEAFEAVKICFERGNDINAVDVNGDTALHGAAHRGANDVIQFLVSRGAKMDVPNKLGWTPWIIADGVFYPNTYNRRLDTAALLLKLGANPKAGSRRPEDLPPSEVK